MAMLLRRRQFAAPCFQLLHHSYEAASSLTSPLIRAPSGSGDFPTGSQQGGNRFVVPQGLRTPTGIEIWRPADCGRWIRSSHSAHGGREVDALPQEKTDVGSGKLVLYRAKWIRPIRLLVRFKLFQLGGVMALAIPLAEYSQQGSLSLGTTLAVGAVVSGAGGASTALWYYSRRLVGEMALLLPVMRIMQISVLDFWGNREDLQYDVSHVLPPLKGMTNEELARAAQQMVIPLDVLGGRQFFLSLRHGHLLHKDVLFSILNGSIEARDIKNP